MGGGSWGFLRVIFKPKFSHNGDGGRGGWVVGWLGG